MTEQPDRGSLGGANTWSGTTYEGAVAAYLATFCLAERSVPGFDLGSRAVPLKVRLQADEPVDDIVCEVTGGRHAYIQAKTRIEFGQSATRGLGPVVRQWIRLAETRHLDPAKDRVIVAAGSASTNVQTLAAALRRVQCGDRELDTPRQAEALEKLRKLLFPLPPAERDALLLCVRFWIEDARTGSAAGLAQANLRDVVVSGAERPGWNALLAIVSRGAALRVGYTADGLRDELRSHDVELRGDAPGTPGATRAAEVRYRGWLERRGTTLTFSGLGATLPALELAGADAGILVTEGAPATPDEDGSWAGELHWWARRRRRVLLTGLPGAGKSTALRQAVARYASLDWPLPILVRLDRLLPRLERASFRDAICDVATEELGSPDREAVRELMHAALDNGRALLALDGLDETRDHRHELLREIQSFLQGVHPDVEVIVTTRDVAYADARILGFTPLRVLPPENLDRTIDAVLNAVCDSRELDGGSRDLWITERDGWVQRCLGANVALKETPLLGVLLAVLAATRSRADLPTERARVAWEIVSASIQQWEKRRAGGAVRAGSLPDSLVPKALEVAFISIGCHVVAHPAPRSSDLRRLVAEEIRAAFDLPEVHAEAVADDALACWDMAGVFVASGDDERVSPRIRLFAEVAVAMRAVALPDQQLRRWLTAVVDESSDHESVLLASELSARVAAAAIETATETGAHSLLAARCATASPELGEESREMVLDALLDSIRSDATSDWWTSVDFILKLAGTSDHRRRALDRLLLGLEPEAQVVLRAVAVLTWRVDGSPADADLRELLVLDREPAPPLGSDDRVSALLRLGAHGRFNAAVVGAARRLLPGNPELAQEAVAMSRARNGRAYELHEVLVEAGLEHLIPDDERGDRVGSRSLIDWKQEQHEREAATRGILEWLVSAAEPATDDPGQLRGLDDLVDYWTTIEINTAAAFEPSGVFRHHNELLGQLVPLFAVLSGLDGGRLSVQAATMLAEMDGPSPDGAHDVTEMLFMPGEDRGMGHWAGVVDEPRAVDQLLRALAVGRWLPPLAGRALASRRLKLVGAHRELLDRIARKARSGGQREYAARLLIALSEDEAATARGLAAETDPALRDAATWWVGHRVRLSRDEDRLLERLLDDADDEVRANMLKALRDAPPDPRLRQLVDEADWTPRGWGCRECGVANEPRRGHRSCVECNVSTSLATVDELLVEVRSRHPIDSVAGR